jgi:hypothetical protein
MVGTLIYCQGFALFSAMHAFILVAHIALHRHAIKAFSDYHCCRFLISRHIDSTSPNDTQTLMMTLGVE